MRPACDHDDIGISTCARTSVSARAALAIYAMVVVAFVVSLMPGCRRASTSAAAATPPKANAHAPVTSTDCRSCHEDIFRAWSQSDHAHAHRPVDAPADADAFQPGRELALHGVEYQVAWKDNRPAFSEIRAPHAAEHYSADFVLGNSPLRQYVVPVGDGRYQMTELAFDPAKKECFSVFGAEERQPGEWGHWRGRGMNWNSMCAACHLTGFRKNYNATTDTYASTWREHGVGCAQCHGDLPPEHGASKRPLASIGSSSSSVDRALAQETCAPCHARNEFLTGDIRPGVRYNDHYRLTLPVEPGVFYPDGQMRDEDFNYTSFLLSRMGGKSRITCLDCHDPHSGKTRLPADNNQLCLQCHVAANPRNAPVIDPVTHSHHGAESAGNRCVSCHMPTTTFMQRDPRHDHGFLKPDPLLTKELAIPNACNRCHTDKSTDWAIEAADRWYGAKMESRQRQRARAVAAVQSASAGGDTALLALATTEDVPAWKATLLTLARNYPATPAIEAAARSALADPDPLVRSAVQVLGALPEVTAHLRPLLKNSSRLVRLDAEWALSAELPEESAGRHELDAYLAVGADQPVGRMRLGQDLFNRGRVREAEAPLRQAIAWDPNSSGIHDALGSVLHSRNREGEAGAEFWRAAQLAPTDADASFRAALTFAAASRLEDAELALRETVRRNPRHDRAWYNLGLLLAQTRRCDAALEALATAESVAPANADYVYAEATVRCQKGDRAGAAAAARRVLAFDPNFTAARGLLRQAESGAGVKVGP